MGRIAECPRLQQIALFRRPAVDTKPSRLSPRECLFNKLTGARRRPIEKLHVLTRGDVIQGALPGATLRFRCKFESSDFFARLEEGTSCVRH